MFERSTPAAEGVNCRGIIRFLDEMKEKRLHMHDMMILRHGKIIMESDFAPWSGQNLHMLFSLSKSFTSTAVGFAVQDGLMKLTDRPVDYFSEKLPARPCENMEKITVRDLLTMNTGHQTEPRHMTADYEKDFLESYVAHTPGSHFLYNTFGTYMLSAMLQKATGRKTLDYLREKFLDPLDMSPDIWTEESPSGVATGGYGMNVRVTDIAKMGQFYLQKGRWDGKQLLNEAWIQDAQTPWSDNSWTREDKTDDWAQGYGYQFWMCRPEHVFRGDGAFGQYCVVMPDQDMVIAINSGVDDMGAVLDSIWSNILPCVEDGPLAKADGALEARLKDTVTPACWEEDGSAVSAPVPEEDWLGTYALQPDNPLGFDEMEVAADRIVFRSGEGETVYPLSLDEWLSAGHGDEAIRAARDEAGLILHNCMILTPFETVLKLSFTAHGTEIRGRRNVGFGGGEFRLIGTRR